MTDLNRLTDLQVRLVGRLVGVNDGRAQFSGSLRNQCALSDLKMNRLLDRIDEWVTENGLDDEVDPPHRFEATRVEASPPLLLDLKKEGIKTVLWACGFRPDYSWLDVPVFDRKGRIRHDGGVVAAPGLYVLGLPFLRKRKSSYMHGAEDDARAIATIYAAALDGRAGVGRELLSEARRVHSDGEDLVLSRSSRFGLGFQLHHESRPLGRPGCFGHFGHGGSLGFADPAAGLAFGYVTNLPGPRRWHQPRTEALIEAVYASL